MLKTQNTNWRTVCVCVRAGVCFNTSDVPVGAHISHNIFMTSPSHGSITSETAGALCQDDTFLEELTPFLFFLVLKVALCEYRKHFHGSE